MSLCRRLLRREGWELGLVSGVRPPTREALTGKWLPQPPVLMDAPEVGDTSGNPGPS